MSAFGIVKATIGPASIPFLIVATLIGFVIIYVWPKHRTLGRAWLVLLYAAYVVFALPVVANVRAASLPAVRPATDLLTLQGIESVVVLDGDNRIGRAQETLKVWHAVTPRQVVVSGEEWLIDKLIEEGIPRARIVHEPTAETTREQILWLAGFARRQHTPIIVIASRLQMPRVAALTRGAGLMPLLAASPVDDEPPTSGLRRYVPSYVALRVSRDAIYEHAALAYYEWRGWIPSTPSPDNTDTRPARPGFKGSSGLTGGRVGGRTLVRAIGAPFGWNRP